MSYSCGIWVLDGKLANANADAIVMTIDPDRILFRKIDREIRRSQNGRGGAYYAQLPLDRMKNLDTFIAKSEYEIMVSSDKYNVGKCICPNCINYDKPSEGPGQILLCSPDAQRSDCKIAPMDCKCQKCPIHMRSYLRKECYCMAEKARLLSNAKYPDILFVSDRYISRLSDIVSSGLSAADKAGYKDVAFPPLRHEVMWKIIENSDSEKNKEIAIGLDRFFREHQDSKIESIKIIVDDNPIVYTELILEIEKHRILRTMLKNKRPGIASLLKTMIKNKKRSIFGK